MGFFLERKMSGTGIITFAKHFVAPEPQTLTYCPEGDSFSVHFKMSGPYGKGVNWAHFHVVLNPPASDGVESTLGSRVCCVS